MNKNWIGTDVVVKIVVIIKRKDQNGKTTYAILVHVCFVAIWYQHVQRIDGGRITERDGRAFRIFGCQCHFKKALAPSHIPFASVAGFRYFKICQALLSLLVYRVNFKPYVSFP